MTTARALLAAVIVAALAAPAGAALNWEGQSGVFMNPLAFVLGPGKTEAGYHYIDMEDLGAVHTVSVTRGLRGGAEIGYTRIATDVPGVSDQNVVHAKYQAVAETPETPAVAFYALYRDLVDDASAVDVGVVGTKVLPVRNHPVIVSLGARSTKALANGLFGIGQTEIKLDGLIAVFVTKNLIVGTEFRQQNGSKTWRDVAARYVVNKNLNIDAGLANFGEGLKGQFAFGATWAF